jgi:DNA-binding CsgD family transcriptional regulator
MPRRDVGVQRGLGEGERLCDTAHPHFTEEAPADLTGLALTSRSGNLHGLTPRELEILGMLVEGCSNCEMSRILRIARRTAAAHVEHILRKLSAPTRTSAAVRADRAGLYVPAPLWTAG